VSWTAPRTWTTAEVTTAAQFNAHIRDNLTVLKVTRNAAGRLPGLTSATLASLSPDALPGLATVGRNNTFTAGRSKFLEAARLVAPVGANKWVNIEVGISRAGFWIDGDYVHHIASDQVTEWRYLGEYVSTPAGAIPGSVWVEGNYLHYIDADGDERRCASAGVTGHADAAALGGSAWVETYVHWIQETGALELPGHADVAHADGSEHNDGHGDLAHADSHADSGHADSHTDGSHADEHFDVAHADDHEDHDDTLGHDDIHLDEAHGDVHVDYHFDTHADEPHSDDHNDSHTDWHFDHEDYSDSPTLNQPTVVT